MAINPRNTFSSTRVDRSGERSSWSVGIADTEVDISTPSAELQALLTSVEAVCEGVQVSQSLSHINKLTNVDFATTGQREHKWLVVYEDDVTLGVYKTELPCRDVAIQPPTGNDKVDLTVAPWVAFKAAWEAAVLTPDGNGNNLLYVELVGRSI